VSLVHSVFAVQLLLFEYFEGSHTVVWRMKYYWVC